MKKKKTINPFAASVLAALIPANVLHLGWTVWLCAEQIETGWNGGTGIEMMALALWMLELPCVLVLLVAAVYFIMSFLRAQRKLMLIANAVLFLCLVGQIVVTNLFLYY